MEFHPAIAGALQGVTTYRGKDSFRRYWADIVEVFEDFQVQPLSYSAWRDYLVVPNIIAGRGKSSGLAIDREITFIWRIRHGTISWGATFFERAEGLEAIGVTERDLKLID